MKNKNTKKNKPNNSPLPWESCECGCHGSELKIGGLYFWTLMEFPTSFGAGNNYSTEGSVFHLNDGHSRYGNDLGTFNSGQKRDNFIRKILEANLVELKKYV